MTRPILILTLIATLTTVAFARDATTEAGVPLIANGAEPSDGLKDLQLKELWRRGGEDDEIFFGVILKAITDKDGNIYLLDQQMSEVQVFDPQGAHLKTLSREGDGPGEVRSPSDMLWMPDGSLGIVQTFPGRIVKVDMDGNPAGVYRTGAEGDIIAVAEARSRGGNLVLGVIDIEVQQGGQDRHLFVGGYDPEGVELCRYTGFDVHWDFNNMIFREREQYFAIFGRWDLCEDGKVVAVPDQFAYGFNFYGADGTLERSVTREFDPYLRTQEDSDLINNIMEGASRQFPFPIETEIEKYEAPIAQLVAHPDGRIWILSARGARNQGTDAIATYDIFDRDGRFRQQARLLCPGDARRDGIYFIGPDRILVVTGQLDALASQFGGTSEGVEEETPPSEVICYRVMD